MTKNSYYLIGQCTLFCCILLVVGISLEGTGLCLQDRIWSGIAIGGLICFAIEVLFGLYRD